MDIDKLAKRLKFANKIWFLILPIYFIFFGSIVLALQIMKQEKGKEYQFLALGGIFLPMWWFPLLLDKWSKK